MYEDDLDDEIELCMGADGVFHLNENRPTLKLSFKTEDEIIEFMATCTVLGINSILIIPEGTRWEIENIQNNDSFLESINLKIDELKAKL